VVFCGVLWHFVFVTCDARGLCYRVTHILLLQEVVTMARVLNTKINKGNGYDEGSNKEG
jgi:hypothetical protein